MVVKDLIELLKTFDEVDEVVVWHEGRYQSVEGAEANEDAGIVLNLEGEDDPEEAA